MLWNDCYAHSQSILAVQNFEQAVFKNNQSVPHPLINLADNWQTACLSVFIERVCERVRSDMLCCAHPFYIWIYIYIVFVILFKWTRLWSWWITKSHIPTARNIKLMPYMWNGFPSVKMYLFQCSETAIHDKGMAIVFYNWMTPLH